MKYTSGLSRREFLRGRFFRALPGTAVRYRRPLVMRYPKTLRDVSSSNPDVPAASNGESSGRPALSPAARRRTIPVHRPPGAIDEPSFLDGCTRCDDCIQACPHDAIVHAPALMREAAGSPMILPDQSACMMCSDYPCIAACGPGVLTHQVPKVMGTARITEHLCVAHHGTLCTVCSEHCPVEDVISVTDGKPAVDEDKCTGCGVCRYVCPAPENAILIMPMFTRPVA